ncbi:MAG: hypothetical protein IJ444_00160 [Kiritimatiellae bacterium]|nr:hypothetical protein [Kiritimatiellia bacterium]
MRLAINGTRVTIGSATTDCLLDVPVRLEGGTTKLTLRNLNTFLQQSLYLNDHATIGPKVNVASSEKVAKVNKLFINGESIPRGTYGSSSSSAEFVDDEHFVGVELFRCFQMRCFVQQQLLFGKDKIGKIFLNLGKKTHNVQFST